MARDEDRFGDVEKRRAARHLPFDAATLRGDTWNDLKYAAHWLTDAVRLGIDQDEPRARIRGALDVLLILESYWCWPGRETVAELKALHEQGRHDALDRRCAHIVRHLTQGVPAIADEADEPAPPEGAPAARKAPSPADRGPRFTVLVVDQISEAEERELRAGLLAARRDEDPFIYDVLVAPTFEDAVIAVLFNATVQSCVIRSNFPFLTANRHEAFDHYLQLLRSLEPPRTYGAARSLTLAQVIRRLRPEVDRFLVSDAPLEEVSAQGGTEFQRVFHRLDSYLELHLSVIKGVASRYETPFFTALREYSKRPTGVFHALPISRGKSIVNSRWIRDMGDFYGMNVFLAETSATSGGLDSLLQPLGPLKRAQQFAARAFGGRRSFFVTNGTSTANKIVMQALIRPGDVVLVSRDCHKSIHYAIVTAGAHVVYLDPYPLRDYSMYGAVPLSEILRHLRLFKEAGTLDRVRMLVLTNCTFDGVTYDPLRIMRDVLALKPDMIFHWDEAWFAFAAFDPLLRSRTGMAAAARLRSMLRSESYAAQYEQARRQGGEAVAAMPDPRAARVRVYVTQSTHKTLTALRQGSMIHVYDEDFDQKAGESFSEAYMTHTSTSPNYQILASLDLGRRQVELEGYELVQRSIGLAMALRRRIYEHPVLRQFFRVLRPADLIPEEHRPSGIEFYFDPEEGWARMDRAWALDEFVLDPTRVNVQVGLTGMDGDTFKHLLMDRFQIQINKTSRNSALFMTNIGMTRGDVAYLVECLIAIARDVSERVSESSALDRRAHEARVASLIHACPPLPNFSRFHGAFRRDDGAPTTEGDMRKAFFLAYDERACDFVRMDAALLAAVEGGAEHVSAGFVTPYPPGFPVLAPGQVISAEILRYLMMLDVKEIHGYQPHYGLRIFRPEALRAAAPLSIAELPMLNLEG